jgi:hypothetical protein
MSVQIEAAEFVNRFFSVPEGSSMFFTKSAEYAQAFVLMLGETEQAKIIQHMKAVTSDSIGIELYRVETEVINHLHDPNHKVRFQFADGTEKSYNVGELYNALKEVYINCAAIVDAMVVEYRITFNVSVKAQGKPMGVLKKDFAKGRAANYGSI